MAGGCSPRAKPPLPILERSTCAILDAVKTPSRGRRLKTQRRWLLRPGAYPEQNRLRRADGDLSASAGRVHGCHRARVRRQHSSPLASHEKQVIWARAAVLMRDASRHMAGVICRDRRQRLMREYGCRKRNSDGKHGDDHAGDDRLTRARYRRPYLKRPAARGIDASGRGAVAALNRREVMLRRGGPGDGTRGRAKAPSSGGRRSC